MKWKLNYYNEKVTKAVLGLPKKLLARYLRMSETMCEYGPNLGMPHTRSMGDGLFELRVKAQEGIARVFYCTVVGQQIIVLHCFVKKTQATPAKELKLAKERLKEVRENE